MKKQIKNLTVILLLVAFIFTQLQVKAFYGRLVEDQGINTNLLPIFKYDRYNIEPNKKTDIEIILKPESKIVDVEVIEAVGAGVGLDNETVKQKGLKIYKSSHVRISEGKNSSYVDRIKARNKAQFNLQQVSSQEQIVKALDYKIFKITVTGVLPGSYIIRAVIDNAETTTTKIITKPDFRIDDISPQVINYGVDSLLTIKGKNLDSLTQVYLGEDVEIKEIESLDDGNLKVTVFANEVSKPEFHDVTITSLLSAMSATLVNGLYVGPRIGKNGEDGEDGKDGEDGAQGEDGKSICANSEATLNVFANNLSSGSKATAFFDPVLCNLTFGIPVGFNGTSGTDGKNGASGINGVDGKSVCTNMSSSLAISSTTLSEGSMATSTFDPDSCTLVLGMPKGDVGAAGAKGEKGDTGSAGAKGDKGDMGTAGAKGDKGDAGTAGLNCWDLNENGIKDISTEDTDKNGVVDVNDCRKKTKGD